MYRYSLSYSSHYFTCNKSTIKKQINKNILALGEFGKQSGNKKKKGKYYRRKYGRKMGGGVGGGGVNNEKKEGKKKEENGVGNLVQV